ncbi:MAG: hypothetical protein IKN58_12865 [Prevotella sp.]|jgi:hypothetical protein|nr:hypothetical protein [Prevotella sp.]
MKKLFIAVMAFLALSACNSDKSDFLYRGLSTSLPLNVFIDSMVQRGFAVDSAAAPDSTGRVVVLKNPAEKYHVLLGQADGVIQAVQENWVLSTNDSTRQMWQKLRDDFEKETGAWPNCPMLKDDHKVAKFELESGFVTITLKNTYTPTLNVLYELKK